MSPGQIFTVKHPCEHSRIKILQWILTKLGTYLVLRRVWNPIDFQSQMSRGQIFTVKHPCEHSRIKILQWILTKLGTYLVLRRVWNPIDFQGQRSVSPGQIFTA
jgi:TusA-related sulfurtransferase